MPTVSNKETQERQLRQAAVALFGESVVKAAEKLRHLEKSQYRGKVEILFIPEGVLKSIIVPELTNISGDGH